MSPTNGDKAFLSDVTRNPSNGDSQSVDGAQDDDKRQLRCSAIKSDSRESDESSFSPSKGTAGLRMVTGRVSRAGMTISARARANIASLARPTKIVRVGDKVPGVAAICAGTGLTKEWLTAAFRFRGYLKPEGQVTSVTSRLLGEGLGAFGDLMKVSLLARAHMRICPQASLSHIELGASS